MKAKNKQYSLVTIRTILGIIFLISGIGKLIDTGYVNYDLVRLLSEKFFWIIEYAAPVIITVSIVELLLAFFLFWGRKLQWVLTISLLMLISFTTILCYFYMQGMNVASCGCFGAFGFASGLEFTLIRNAVLLLLNGGGLLLLTRQKEAL